MTLKPLTGGFLCGEKQSLEPVGCWHEHWGGGSGDVLMEKEMRTMSTYNPNEYSPSYGGQIDSNGDIKNLADAISGTGSGTKLKVDAGPPQVIFIQSTAMSEWVIDHNLGRFPQVTTTDTDGVLMAGQVTWPTINRVVITFTPATAGRAVLT